MVGLPPILRAARGEYAFLTVCGALALPHAPYVDEVKHMKVTIAAVAVAMLAGCAGNATAIPPQSTLTAPGTLPGATIGGVVGPDVTAPPKCKGQKQTKYYATVAKQDLKESKGTAVCVPAFGGWGGGLQFPGTYNVSYTVSMTSSLKAYKGGLFPTNGSQTPIFYLQFAFSGFPGFYTSIPKGTPLESTHLLAGKPYTILVLEYFYALGWSTVGECYQTAKKATHGNGLAGAGTIFEKVTFLEMHGILEVFKGELVDNKCA